MTRPVFIDKEINLLSAPSKAHILHHHALYMVTPEVLKKEKNKARLQREDTSETELEKAWLRAAPDPVRSRLSLGEKTASFHSCGNLIGSLFLAVRSQTENFPPRLCLKVFSSGRLSLTSSLSHRPNWFVPPLGLPQQPAHASFTASVSLRFDYLFTALFPQPDRTHLLRLSAHSIELNI